MSNQGIGLGAPPDRGGLGTIAGVFTHSFLTILGIILFLRTGFLVGRTGLFWTLVIIGLSNLISLLTVMSLSAIATNIRVRTGGVYFLIARTLGVEYGGAIGVVLYMAQAISVAFYCFGFGEAVAALLPDYIFFSPRWIATALLVLLSVFALLGADWASRLQFAVMAILGAALLAFFAGGVLMWDNSTLASNWDKPAGGMTFWVAFALFFPAVTGFTQGVNMSGDLRNPARSLPLGSFSAVGIGMLIYFAAAIVLAATLPGSVLSEDYQAMSRVARPGALVFAGVLSATASSAMAAYLGAPRILQALAADHVFPALKPFAKGAGADNNPRRGVLLSGGIGLIVIAAGELNTVAPVVAMFYLISYGLLNYATWFESRTASPHFRPQFRYFNKYLSLAGAAGCLLAMLAIHPAAALVSVAVLFGVYEYVKRTAGKMQWADSQRSYNFQRIRELLLEIQTIEPHPRDWRPQILALTDDSHRRRQLLCFGSWIEGNSGNVTAVSIVEDASAADRQSELLAELSREIEDWGIPAFPLVIRAHDFRTTMTVLLQAHGLGPIKPNIVLLNWLDKTTADEQEQAEARYARNMRDALEMGCNVVVLNAAEKAIARIEAGPTEGRRIDVWWAGGSSSELALMLAYLMTRTAVWQDARICVHAQGSRKRPESTLAQLRQMLDDIRIETAVDIIGEPLDREVVRRHCKDATLILMPMHLSDGQPANFLNGTLDELSGDGAAVAFVHAFGDFALDIDPDDDNDAKTDDEPRVAAGEGGPLPAHGDD